MKEKPSMTRTTQEYADGYIRGFFDCLEEMQKQREEAALWQATEHLLPEEPCQKTSIN